MAMSLRFSALFPHWVNTLAPGTLKELAGIPAGPGTQLNRCSVRGRYGDHRAGRV